MTTTGGKNEYRKCVVQNCTSDNTDKTKCTLFAFPLEWKILCEWLDFAKANGSGIDLRGGLCELHFTKSCFIEESGDRRLKFAAIPSLTLEDIAKLEKEKPLLSKKKKKVVPGTNSGNPLGSRRADEKIWSAPLGIKTVQGLPCPLCCEEYFYCRRDLRQHLKSLIDRRLTCPMCYSQFPSIQKLVNHLRHECEPDDDDESIDDKNSTENLVEEDAESNEPVDEDQELEESEEECILTEHSETVTEDPIHADAILHLDHTVAQQVEIESGERPIGEIIAKRSMYRLKVTNSRHKCPQCTEVFDDNNELSLHLRKVHGSMPVFRCRKCGFRSPEWKGYSEHACVKYRSPAPIKLKLNMDMSPSADGVKVFPCPFKCGEISTTNQLRQRHKLLCPKKIDIKTLRCKKCNKIYPTLSSLKKHHEWHLNHEFPCPSCPSILSSRNGRLMHIRENHRPDKANECRDCGLPLPNDVTIESLKGHVCQPLAFGCTECSRRFSSKSTLDKHLVSHVKSTLKNICDECGAAFCHYIRLQNHKQMHANGTFPKKAPKVYASVNDLPELSAAEQRIEIEEISAEEIEMEQHEINEQGNVLEDIIVV